MRRNLFYLTLIFCLIILAGFYPSFAQIAPVDKNTLSRFERSVAQGKIEEIERSLLDLAVANPNNPQVLNLLAQVRVMQNRPSEAAALYRRILSLDANSATAKINLARIAFYSGQVEEAKRLLDEVDENSVASAPLRLNLAATLLLVGEPDKSLKATEKLPLEMKNNDALPVIAASYAALKNGQKLRDLLPEMKAAARNPTLSIQLAKILQNVGLNSEAVNLLRLTLVAAPNNFDILIMLAKAGIGAKDFAAAGQYLSRAAKLQPRVAELFFAQALLEEAQGNSAAALELLKQSRLLAPDAPEILSQFVITALRANQSGAAVKAAQRLVTLNPDEPDYLYLLGAASLQNNEIIQAQNNLQRLMELRPTDSRGCLVLGLTLAAQSDQIENARKQLLHCIEIDAENVEAKYQLGLSYKAQGENAKAIEYLEETVKQAPNYAPALRDLGALYLQANEEKKARVALEKSAALDASDADTHFQLSRLYNLIGEPALAKQHFDLFQKLKNPAGKSM